MLLLRHPAQSSAEWSQSRSPSNLVSGQDSTMWLIICTPPHWHLSDNAMYHLWRLASQRPCPVRKRFNIDHAERPRLKPRSRIVGSEMTFLLATETDCHSSLHWDKVSAGDRSYQIGFLEVRRGGGWLKKSRYTGHSRWFWDSENRDAFSNGSASAVAWLAFA